MCEILIKTTDNHHPDPALDVRTYKRGDPVDVMPDGYNWFPAVVGESYLGMVWRGNALSGGSYAIKDVVLVERPVTFDRLMEVQSDGKEVYQTVNETSSRRLICIQNEPSFNTENPNPRNWKDLLQMGKEELSKFVVIKVPGVPKEKALKYMDTQWGAPVIQERQAINDKGETVTLMDELSTIVRRRLWRFRWDDLDLAGKLKLQTSKELVIKALSAYKGSYDYTWTDIKSYFHNKETVTNEAADLI